MSDHGDVAIVGAGPYGLSLAAHLRASGVPFRHFGMPMELWQSAMPRGMFLKSQGFASNLSSPDGAHTLEAFCAATGRAYASYGLPVPLDTFVAYGQWFQRELVPDVEETMVTDVAPADGYYDITLADGRRTQARSVVVAVGVQHFASVPEQLTGLPRELCTHSSAHVDLSSFRGRKVVVLGAGHSALESGALLHESGADVKLVARESEVRWNGAPLPLDRPGW
jgi:FAD-dependent urate hydroxylase